MGFNSAFKGLSGLYTFWESLFRLFFYGTIPIFAWRARAKARQLYSRPRIPWYNFRSVRSTCCCRNFQCHLYRFCPQESWTAATRSADGVPAVTAWCHPKSWRHLPLMARRPPARPLQLQSLHLTWSPTELPWSGRRASENQRWSASSWRRSASTLTTGREVSRYQFQVFTCQHK